MSAPPEQALQLRLAAVTTAIHSVGVPKEIKIAEHRVAMTPDGVRELERHGIQVCVEAGAGEGASITDADYQAAGADIVATAEDAWAQELVVKVKEPKEEEFGFLRDDLTLFTYLHLAAYPDVAKALLAAGTTSLAYETVQLDTGALPLLAPMSEVAGRLAPQQGAHFLERHKGGRGRAHGRRTGRAPGQGGGPRGRQRRLERGVDRGGHGGRGRDGGQEPRPAPLGRPDSQGPDHDRGVQPGRDRARRVRRRPGHRSRARAGGRAPVIVSEDMVRAMKPRAVIVDVAVDQGGCIETTRETTHDEPVYETHGVVHYAVGNMPGAVPNTSTYALTNATLPYIQDVAVNGSAEAARRDPAIAYGVNTVGGKVTNAPVAEFLGVEYVEPLAAFAG